MDLINLTVTLISAEATHTVRHPVLRAGKPVETCIFKGDGLTTTYHLGLFLNATLIGVLSLMKENNALVDGEDQYQLRGMAVLQNYQGKGYGSILIKHAINLLKTKAIPILWCNAREVAVNFYKCNGFNIVGDAFQIPEIGTHYVMYKPLLTD